jgi:glycosyltransferase involved in cell wall biosynthesis
MSGWAFDPAQPEARVTIVVSADGHAIGQVIADQYRADLEDADIGDGRHGFLLTLSDILAPGVSYAITAARQSDGAPIDPFPVVLPAVAEPPATPPTIGKLIGNLDTVSRTRVDGWAIDELNTARQVGLAISANGQVIGQVLANRYREDLEQAGYGDGHHGFTLTFPELSPIVAHELRIRRPADGAELPGSPRTLPALSGLDPDAEQWFASLIAAIEADSGERRALAFLGRQMEYLLSRRADRDSGRSARLARDLFRRRWGNHADAQVEAKSQAPRALVIDDRFPDAGRDAGSVAILSHMRALAALGFEISFAAAGAMDDRAAQALEEEGFAVCGEPFYYTVEDVLKRQAGCFDLVYLHRLSNARQYLALARTHQPKARIVYSVADLHHLRLTRQGEIQRRPEVVALGRRVGFAEMTAAQMADAVITHSPFEAELLARTVSPGKVHVVPWAVAPRPRGTPFAERWGLALIGQFEHAPNPDAASWFIQSVMPLVWTEQPWIQLLIVGHGWTEERLPGHDKLIEIIGPVDDLEQVFDRVRLTVAPLRFGAGIKGKVLESFAAGIPCVMSPVAAEGLAPRWPLDELVGDDADALARTILRFHGDEAANRAATEAGLAMIAEEFSEQRVLEAMAKVAARPGLTPPE